MPDDAQAPRVDRRLLTQEVERTLQVEEAGAERGAAFVEEAVGHAAGVQVLGQFQAALAEDAETIEGSLEGRGGQAAALEGKRSGQMTT